MTGNLELELFRSTCTCTDQLHRSYSCCYKSLLVAKFAMGSPHRTYNALCSMVWLYLHGHNWLDFKLYIACIDLQISPKMLKNILAHVKCSIMLWCT